MAARQRRLPVFGPLEPSFDAGGVDSVSAENTIGRSGSGLENLWVRVRRQYTGTGTNSTTKLRQCAGHDEAPAAQRYTYTAPAGNERSMAARANRPARPTQATTPWSKDWTGNSMTAARALTAVFISAFEYAQPHFDSLRASDKIHSTKPAWASSVPAETSWRGDARFYAALRRANGAAMTLTTAWSTNTASGKLYYDADAQRRGCGAAHRDPSSLAPRSPRLTSVWTTPSPAATITRDRTAKRLPCS